MICLVHVNPLPCIPNTCTYKLTLCMCQWCYFNILKFLVQSYVIETVWSQCGILKHNFKSQVTNSMLKLRTGIKKKLMVSRVCEEPSIKSCTEVCSMKSIFLWLAGFKTWLAMELPLLLQKYLLMHFLIAYLNLHCLIFWSNLGEMVIVDQCVFFFIIIPTFSVQGTFCVNIINYFWPWLSLPYQAKTMGKGTTFMKRVASQNLILQYYQSSRSLEDFAILCPMERWFYLAVI